MTNDTLQPRLILQDPEQYVGKKVHVKGYLKEGDTHLLYLVDVPDIPSCCVQKKGGILLENVHGISKRGIIEVSGKFYNESTPHLKEVVVFERDSSSLYPLIWLLVPLLFFGIFLKKALGGKLLGGDKR